MTQGSCVRADSLSRRDPAIARHGTPISIEFRLKDESVAAPSMRNVLLNPFIAFECCPVWRRLESQRGGCEEIFWDCRILSKSGVSSGASGALGGMVKGLITQYGIVLYNSVNVSPNNMLGFTMRWVLYSTVCGGLVQHHSHRHGKHLSCLLNSFHITNK